MKIKELISLLQQIDPSGEEDILVGNEHIEEVDVLPSYYDGRKKKITFDEKDKPIKIEYIGEGRKIFIRYLTVEDAIDRNSDIEIVYNDRESSYKEENEKYRALVKEFEAKRLSKP